MSADDLWPSPEEVSEITEEGLGFWKSCSGCHETNEGHPTGPIHPVLRCSVGFGCTDCGGIGAVWDTTDYGAMCEELALPAPPAEDVRAGALEWRGLDRSHMAPGIPCGYAIVGDDDEGWQVSLSWRTCEETLEGTHPTMDAARAAAKTDLRGRLALIPEPKVQLLESLVGLVARAKNIIPEDQTAWHEAADAAIAAAINAAGPT